MKAGMKAGMKAAVSKARAQFSGDRNRFQDGGYDLDLTYITDNIIAMGYPAAGAEKAYRNNINDVSKFLNSKHPKHYMIFNLSGREYDYNKFDGQVLPFGFPDHHAPPLNLLMCIVKSIRSWLSQDATNVAIVHCLAGKGRTGTVISCYLLESQQANGADAALEIFANKRSESGSGVTVPSQIRYVHYYAKLLQLENRHEIITNPPSVVFKRIIMNESPRIERWKPALQIFTAPSDSCKGELIFSSVWEAEHIKQLQDTEGTMVAVEIDRIVRGDVLILCYHLSPFKPKELVWRCSLNSYFLRGGVGVERLYKTDLDLACTDDRFEDTFCIDLFLDDNATEAEEDLERVARQNRMAFEQGKEGYLQKQGELNQAWKKRWFVLRRNALHYYRKAKDLKPAGTILITPLTIIEQMEDPAAFRFTIQVATRTYNCISESHEEMRQWLTALRTAKEYVTHGRPSAWCGGETANQDEDAEEAIAAALSSINDTSELLPEEE